MRATMFLIGLVVSPAAALGQATFQGLGDLEGGQFFSRAEGVSGDGSTVVGTGTSNFIEEAFVWTLEGGMVGLGTNGGIASVGQAASENGAFLAGWSRNGATSAVRWNGTDPEGLGDLPGGGVRSHALDISADGSVVVGRGRNSAEVTEAFIWTQQGGLTGLGAVTGGQASHAQGVSADGTIVVGQSGPEAFMWTEAGGMVGLGDLPGGSFDSVAHDISPDGSVIVGSCRTDIGSEACRWVSGGAAEGLGNLLPDGDYGEAWGVATGGSVIVGASGYGTAAEAFIWDPQNGMRRLQSVLEDDYGLSVGNLRQATGVSDDGRTIVGHGSSQAWIATVPVLECSNEIDDDGDMEIDSADPGCTDPEDLSEKDPNLPCDDGLDNDGDGFSDFPDDLGCDDPGDTSEYGSAACDDGIDNDGDQLADLEDPGCSGPSDLSELSSVACDNGTDDDGDGLIDASNDPGCSDATDTSEKGLFGCDDGVDNDGDNDVDLSDGGCTGPSDLAESNISPAPGPGEATHVWTGEIIDENVAGIAVGDAARLAIQFDLDAPDSDPSPTLGIYSAGAQGSMLLSVLTPPLSGREFVCLDVALAVVSDGALGDSFSAEGNDCYDNGVAADLALIVGFVRDSTGSAFSSDGLPVEVLDFGQFDEKEVAIEVDPSQGFTAQLSTSALVPEPAGGGMAALLVLGAMAWFRSRGGVGAHLTLSGR